MSKALPQAVQDAQKAGKTVLELTGDDDKKYYFVKPGTKDIERFIATATKGKAFSAVKTLVLEKALSPSADELSREYEENPGKMVALNDALQSAVGMREDFAVKKL